VTGPRTRPNAPPPPLREAATAAVEALLDIRLPPKPRRAVQALQAALEASDGPLAAARAAIRREEPEASP
jgi:hypothetical protein